MLEVGGKRLARARGEGQEVGPSGFAGANPNRAITPMQVVKPEGDDFPHAQAQIEHAPRHGVAPAAWRRAAIEGLEEAVGFFLSERARQGGQPPAREGGDRGKQGIDRIAVVGRTKAQVAAQRAGAHARTGGRVPAPAAGTPQERHQIRGLIRSRPSGPAPN